MNPGIHTVAVDPDSEQRTWVIMSAEGKFDDLCVCPAPSWLLTLLRVARPTWRSAALACGEPRAAQACRHSRFPTCWQLVDDACDYAMRSKLLQATTRTASSGLATPCISKTSMARNHSSAHIDGQMASSRSAQHPRAISKPGAARGKSCPRRRATKPPAIPCSLETTCTFKMTVGIMHQRSSTKTACVNSTSASQPPNPKRATG